MKRKICWVITITVLVVFISCNRAEILDSKDDYILIKSLESAQNQNSKGVDVEALNNYVLIYEKKGDKAKLCLCNALIGYNLFLMESMINR